MPTTTDKPSTGTELERVAALLLEELQTAVNVQKKLIELTQQTDNLVDLNLPRFNNAVYGAAAALRDDVTEAATCSSHTSLERLRGDAQDLVDLIKLAREDAH